MTSITEGAGAYGGLSDLWNTGLQFGADSSFDQLRGVGTVPTNAINSMQPVSTNAGTGWTDFWRSTAQNVIGYAIQKDAIQSGIVRTNTGGAAAGSGQAGGQGAQQEQARPRQGSTLLIVGGVVALGLLAFVALRK